MPGPRSANARTRRRQPNEGGCVARGNTFPVVLRRRPAMIDRFRDNSEARMPEYDYPVVYVTEIETRPQPIPGVPTSISVFMGRDAIAAIGGLLDRLPPQ